MFRRNSNENPEDSNVEPEETDTGDYFESSFDDTINDILAESLSETMGEGVIVSKWVVVAEIVGSDTKGLVSTPSSAVSPWDFIGMLRSESAIVETRYTNQFATPFSDEGDE